MRPILVKEGRETALHGEFPIIINYGQPELALLHHYMRVLEA